MFRAWDDRVLHKFGRDVRGEVRKSIKSSVNKPYLCNWVPQVTPLISGFSRIAIARVSMAMENIISDNGKTCLAPLAMCIGGE